MNIDHLTVDALSADAPSDDLQILFFDTFSSPSIEDRPFDVSINLFTFIYFLLFSICFHVCHACVFLVF